MRCITTTLAILILTTVAFTQDQPAPEEGLPGPARYLAEIERRQRELALFQQQADDLHSRLVASYMMRESSRAIVRENDEAPIALKGATERTLALLRANPTYQRARETLIKAQAREQAGREVAGLAGTEPVAGAITLPTAKAEVARLEKQALESDPLTIAARQRQQDAERAYAQLLKDAEAFAQGNEKLAELSKSIEDTLADLNAAGQDLQSAYAMQPKAGEFLDWEMAQAMQDYQRYRPNQMPKMPKDGYWLRGPMIDIFSQAPSNVIHNFYPGGRGPVPRQRD